ncbi:MAG: hypothetical protein JWN44_7189 [Myxococcales bacterium]|nr:hypothetical protein [Myxococcales bacterium]
MTRRPLVAAALLAILATPTRTASGDALDSAAIFGPPQPYAIESIKTRYTHLDQRGHGYQSQAGGPPGDEALTVEQPQLEVIARQGEHIVHRLWVPLDVVTGASPDALDAISSASRTTEAGSIEIASTWQATRATAATVHGGFHLEENYRSYDVGGAVTHSFADDNATIAVSLNQVMDWFDGYDIRGNRLDRVGRSATNVNLGLTQLLSPTTVGHLDYGVTLQNGTLGNTWNAVPLASGTLGGELLPAFRQRHAFVGRLAQWLPWKGALHAYYRFYVDDWGLRAHSAEVQLYQRLSAWLWLRLTYRVHQQNGVSFFTTAASPTATRRTADSDLAPFIAQTFGGAVGVDLRMIPRLRQLYADFSYERYVRTNDLQIDVYSAALGVRF